MNRPVSPWWLASAAFFVFFGLLSYYKTRDRQWLFGTAFALPVLGIELYRLIRGLI